MKDNTSIKVVEFEISETAKKIRQVTVNYRDGSGPRLSYEAEIKALTETLSILCKTLVNLNNKEAVICSEPAININLPESIK